MSQRKIGIILAYLSEAIRVCSSLIYTPIMLKILGDTEYGLYQLVASTVSYLSLLNLGFTGAYTRFYTKAKLESENTVKVINGMFMKTFLIMSFLCIICGAILLYETEIIFGDKLTYENYQEARILIFILILSMSLTFPTSVFVCNINANERFLFEKGISLLQNLLNPFLCLPVLLLGYGNIGIVMASFVLTLAKFIVCAFYCIKKLGMRFDFKGFNIKLFREMGAFTFFVFLNQIIDQINWNLDKFLLGRYASLSAVALYGIGGQLNSLYITCSNTISAMYAPMINKIVIKDNDDKRLTKIFIQIGRIQYIIVCFILLGFIIFGKEFICLWAGANYIKSYNVAFILMLPMFVPLIQNIGIEIQRAKNQHQVRSIVYLVMSLFNALISIPLIMNYHAFGAALGTAFSLLLGNIIFMNIYYHKKLGINILHFWHSILEMLMPTIISCLCGIFINYIIIDGRWIFLIIKMILFSIIYFILFWICGFNEYEKSIVREILYKIKYILFGKL